MNATEMIEFFRTLKSGDEFVILDYESKTEGRISTMRLRHIGHSGYLALVRESLTELSNRTPAVRKAAALHPIEANAAIDKLMAQCTRTLTGAALTKAQHEMLIPHKDAPLLELSSAKPGILVLRNIELLQMYTCVKTRTDELTGRRDPVNIAVDELKAVLPIGRFIGRLNLVPDLHTVRKPDQQ